MRRGLAMPGRARIALGLMAALAVSVVAAWSGVAEGTRITVFLIGGVVCGGLGVASLSLRGSALAPVGWVGAAAAGVALVIVALLVFGGGRNLQQAGAPLRTLMAAALVALLVADLAMLGRLRLRSWPGQVVQVLAILPLAVLTVASLLSAVLGEWDPVSGLLSVGRPPGGVILLGLALVGAHLALPWIGRMETALARRRMASAEDRAVATLRCPRCECWLQMRSGSIACPRCALQIRFEFAEPRCGCGYPLHRLSGSHCPECGREVPSQERWGTASRSGGASPATGLSPSSPALPSSPP